MGFYVFVVFCGFFSRGKKTFGNTLIDDVESCFLELKTAVIDG